MPGSPQNSNKTIATSYLQCVAQCQRYTHYYTPLCTCAMLGGVPHGVMLGSLYLLIVCWLVGENMNFFGLPCFNFPGVCLSACLPVCLSAHLSA